MNEYRIAYMVNDRINSITVEANYYVKERGFIDFIADGSKVMSIKAEYVINVTKTN